MRWIVAAAAIAATAACSQAKSQDAGPEVSRNYQVAGFTGVEVGGPYRVDVRTGARASVVGRGTQKLMDRTIVEVRDGKLVIRPKKERSWMHFGGDRHEKAAFTVTVPELRSAAIGGSGSINVDQVKGESFEGNIGGSGSIIVGKTEVRTLKLAIGGSGSLQPGSGTAQLGEYDIAGSGDIQAAQVQLQQAKVTIAGSGSVRGHATGTADVDIVGSGDVELSGGAKCNVSKMGSGKVHCS